MFWKNAKISRLSILNQLMIIYSLSVLGVILVIGIVFYPLFLYMAQLGKDPHLTQKCYLIVSLLLFSVFTTIAGYCVAKSGLKKLKAFALQLKSIKTSSLHQRILLKEYPNELKLLGESFNEMLDRVERSFQQLSEFSSNIAHELRTPLHNLMHSTEKILSDYDLPVGCQSLLESNLEEYQHLAKLIKQLLFLAKSENGQILLDKIPVSLRAEIEHLLEYYQLLSKEKNIQLTCTGDAEARVDVILFRQLINNLLSNAIHFTPPAGKIDITIESKKEEVLIFIKDSGIGISEHDLNRIFERFYRSDHSRNQSLGGFGLGLSIVKSIIKLHGGNIVITSTQGQGTLITVQLKNG